MAFFAFRTLTLCPVAHPNRLRAQNVWICSVAGFSVGDYCRPCVRGNPDRIIQFDGGGHVMLPGPLSREGLKII